VRGSRKKPVAPEDQKEAGILHDTLKYLKAEGIWHRRVHVGIAWKRSFPLHLFEEGTPDIVLSIPAWRRVINPWKNESEVYPVARMAWIECKRPVGGRWTPPQVKFRDRVIEERGLLWLINDVEKLRYYIPPSSELDLGLWRPNVSGTTTAGGLSTSQA
jgi:hypothetical protein